MVKFFGWPASVTPFDARIRIVENIEKLEEWKFVEEKTDKDIAQERRNQLAKARNEKALSARREWEEKRGGYPSKRARPTVDDQDDQLDIMDIDDNNHDYVQT